MSQVNEDALKPNHTMGVVKVDDQKIQIIYGTTVPVIKNAVNKKLK